MVITQWNHVVCNVIKPCLKVIKKCPEVLKPSLEVLKPCLEVLAMVSQRNGNHAVKPRGLQCHQAISRSSQDVSSNAQAVSRSSRAASRSSQGVSRSSRSGECTCTHLSCSAWCTLLGLMTSWVPGHN